MSNKIDKKGLWFKLHESASTEEYYGLMVGRPVSVYTWFWKGMGLLFFCTLIGLAGLGVLFIMMTMVSFLLSPLTGYHGLSETGLYFVIVLPILFLMIGMLSTLEGNMEVWPKWIKDPLHKLFKSSKPKTPKKPKSNILIQYYKARKEKWCPMLTLEDGDE